jgi:hypothetical protein
MKFIKRKILGATLWFHPLKARPHRFLELIKMILIPHQEI